MSLSCWKKLISRNGETELAVSLWRQDLIDFIQTLAAKLPIVGPCDVDVIDRDGELFLIELNMRFGGGYPVSQLAGAAFPQTPPPRPQWRMSRPANRLRRRHLHDENPPALWRSPGSTGRPVSPQRRQLVPP